MQTSTKKGEEGLSRNTLKNMHVHFFGLQRVIPTQFAPQILLVASVDAYAYDYADDNDNATPTQLNL